MPTGHPSRPPTLYLFYIGDLTIDASELQSIDPEPKAEEIIPSRIVDSQIRWIHSLPRRHCLSSKNTEFAAREREGIYFGWGRRSYSRFIPSMNGRKTHGEEHTLVVDRLGFPDSMLSPSAEPRLDLAAEQQSNARIVDPNPGSAIPRLTAFVHGTPSEALLESVAGTGDVPEASSDSRASCRNTDGRCPRLAHNSLDYRYAKVPSRCVSDREDPTLCLDGHASPRGFCRVCHVCFARTWSSTHCYFCGHQLCSKCLCEVSGGTERAHIDFSHHPSPVILRDGPRYVQPSNPESKNHAHEGHAVVPTTILSEQHSWITQQSSTSRQIHHHERITEYGFKAEETSQEESSAVATQKSRTDSEQFQNQRGRRARSIQQNPFLIADKEARAQATTNNSIQQAECDDPTCRATHAGHYPFRHSVACALQRSRISESQEGSTREFQSRTDRSESSKKALDSGNDTVHRHHSSGFHNTHHILEHLSAAVGHDVHGHTVRVSSESVNGSNIEPLRQLEPLTQIQPVTRVASFKHDEHRPTGPSNRAAESSTKREMSDVNRVDQVRRLIETNSSASQWKTGGFNRPKSHTKTAQIGDGQTHSLMNQRDGAHLLKQPLHPIKHTKPIHFAETQGDNMMKSSSPETSRRDSTSLNRHSTRNREAYSKLVNSTFTEKTGREVESEKRILPQGRLLSPPSWLQHPSREAADATARLKHIDTRSHECLAHNHGYLSNISVENGNGKRLTRSKSCIHEYDATRSPHDHVANSNREDQQRVAAPSPLTALHSHEISEASSLAHQDSSVKEQQNSFQHDKSHTIPSQSPRIHAPRFSNYNIPEISEPRERVQEDWRESRSTQEQYQKATLHAEAELSKLLSADQETHGSWPSEKATPTSEIVTMPLQPRQISSHYAEASASVNQISHDETTRREASTLVDKSPDLEIHRPMAIAPPNHDCTWKERYLALTAEIRQLKAEMSTRTSWKESEMAAVAHNNEREAEYQDEDLGIEGLTIVMHLRGKDDLVINTDLTQDFE
ncbi:hypothetical protein F4775DRAFT_598477 [Biscogniauxia sp. FL1348]|nr:hypothetical protein F4775DRAFT_598477 [Biscogniauxia sp. FL1348]